MCVILCTQPRGQSKTCSLASAKRRGMHLPVNPDLSFFFNMLSSYLAKLPATGEPMFSEVCMQSHARLAVGGHQQMPPNCRLAAYFHVSMYTHKYSHACKPYETLLPSLFLCVSSVSLSFCLNEKQMKRRRTVYKVSCAGLAEEILVHLDSLRNPLPQCLITWRDNARSQTSTHTHIKPSPPHRGL